jgi:hypothetical protein
LALKEKFGYTRVVRYACKKAWICSLKTARINWSTGTVTDNFKLSPVHWFIGKEIDGGARVASCRWCHDRGVAHCYFDRPSKYCENLIQFVDCYILATAQSLKHSLDFLEFRWIVTAIREGDTIVITENSRLQFPMVLTSPVDFVCANDSVVATVSIMTASNPLITFIGASVITPKPARHDHFKTGQPSGLRTTTFL